MKRRGWAWAIISVMFVLMIVVLVANAKRFSIDTTSYSWNEQVLQGSGPDKIVQLFVEDVIAQQPGYGGSFHSSGFISQLNQAMNDDSVKGVVIRVDSPGGEVVASDEIYNKIVEVKQAGKPVIVSMGSVAASGGYYISAPADYIFANPATLTGSLGVIFSIPNFEKAADWIGYKENVIKSGIYKDIGNPLREMSAGEREVFQALVDESYQRFVDIIAEGRKLPRQQVLKIADGRVYSGRQAKELKLIDEFGSLEDATRYAADLLKLENPQVVTYTSEEDLMSILTGLQQKTNLSAADVLHEIAPRFSAQPRLLYLFQP